MSNWYLFTCPDCPATFTVDGPAREDLLTVGCVHCGATLTPAAFEPREDAPRAVA